jgi:hypothetical protein
MMTTKAIWLAKNNPSTLATVTARTAAAFSFSALSLAVCRPEPANFGHRPGDPYQRTRPCCWDFFHHHR